MIITPNTTLNCRHEPPPSQTLLKQPEHRAKRGQNFPRKICKNQRFRRTVTVQNSNIAHMSLLTPHYIDTLVKNYNMDFFDHIKLLPCFNQSRQLYIFAIMGSNASSPPNKTDHFDTISIWMVGLFVAEHWIPTWPWYNWLEKLEFDRQFWLYR